MNDYVEVIPNGTETISQMFDRLFALTVGKTITKNAKFSWVVGGLQSFYNLMTNDTGSLDFTACMATATQITIYRANIKSSGSILYSDRISIGSPASAYHDDNSGVTAATVARIYF